MAYPYVAVLAADQTPGNNETTVNGGTSPTDGGFTPGWDQEAEQRVQARRTRVQAVAATENPARPPTTQAQQNIDEVDEDDEERKLHLLGLLLCLLITFILYLCRWNQVGSWRFYLLQRTCRKSIFLWRLEYYNCLLCRYPYCEFN